MEKCSNIVIILFKKKKIIIKQITPFNEALLLKNDEKISFLTLVEQKANLNTTNMDNDSLLKHIFNNKKKYLYFSELTKPKKY